MGLTVFTSICLFGPVSGGHFNPAVTLGVFIREFKISNALFMLKIWFSQLLGAILGAYIVFLTQNEQNEVLHPGIAKLCTRNYDFGSPKEAC